MVDSKQGSNLLYLPLDKLIQMTSQVAAETATVVSPVSVPNPDGLNNTSNSTDVRARDAARARTRETR
jgi:membrane protease subunit HflK